jgi:putative ABC transport system permease protein
MRESKYYEKQSEALGLFVGILGTLIAVFFSGGAMIGAMITMYASVSSRHREVGTLRALGFSRTSVLASFLLEACMISTLGGALGCLASLALGTVKFSMMNFATWSEIVFTFRPTPQILVTSMIAAVIMGVVGGFWPALTAAIIVTSMIAAVIMGVVGGFWPALTAARLSVVEAMKGE